MVQVLALQFITLKNQNKMRHIIVSEHSEECKHDELVDMNDENNWVKRLTNTCQKRTILVYTGTEFTIIEYQCCLFGQYVDDHTQSEYLLKSLIKQSKIYDAYEFCRPGLNADEYLKHYRKNGITNKFKNWITVNHIYYDNAYRKYYIATKHNFLDTMINSDNLLEDYREMYKYLEKNNFDKYFIKNLDDLYFSNCHVIPDKIEVFKTIESLSKEINQLTK